jgi:hypothetical protein
MSQSLRGNKDLLVGHYLQTTDIKTPFLGTLTQLVTRKQRPTGRALYTNDSDKPTPLVLQYNYTKTTM